MSRIEELSESQCVELLRAGLVGRLSFWADGPHVVPVNFSVNDATLVLRTTADSLLATHAPGTVVALEIDNIDYEGHRGWSVVASGPCLTIDDPEDVIDSWEPRPWADGVRETYLGIAWDRLSGRRVGGGWTRANEVPVRRRV